jgi:predicted PolB exonuclease-like 3'-5' exonuclease
LISAFVDRIAELSPQLATFNGSSFDLPVLRYRAMVHGVAAPGLFSRPYFNRYTEDAVDPCDVLSSYNSQGKVTLHDRARQTSALLQHAAEAMAYQPEWPRHRKSHPNKHALDQHTAQQLMPS